jgi:hypothetical protein
VSIFRRLFGSGRDASAAEATDADAGTDASGPGALDDDAQSVVAWVRLADAAFENEREQARVFALEDALMRAVYESHVGSYDTNDLLPGYFGMRMTGADADAIVRCVVPLLANVPPGSYLAIRRGPPGTTEDRAELPVPGG